MTKQYLVGLRSALIGAAIIAFVFVPLTSTLAQVSPVAGGDNITQPRLYPRTNYDWPFATGPYYGNVIAAVPGTIRTPVGSFHLSQGELPFPSELKTANRLAEIGTQHFLVQTYPKLSAELEYKLAASGGTVVEYSGNGTLVVLLNKNAYAAIENDPGVAGITPYHAAFKLHPAIGREPLPDPIQATSSVYALDVLVWDAGSARLVAEQMTALGVNVIGIAGDKLLVQADRSLLPNLAQMEQVRVIFESLPNFLHAEETTTVMQVGQWVSPGATPYGDAGIAGGGNGTLFCAAPDAAYTPCDENGDCASSNDCSVPATQVLMVLDTGIQLDAGDLSNTRSESGWDDDLEEPVPGHRKVLAYETTLQFSPGGGGDLLGCDNPQQGGSTHGHVVSATALGNATTVAPAYGQPWFAADQQSQPWDLDGVAMKAKLVAYDAQVTPPTVSCDDPLSTGVLPGELWDPGNESGSSLGKSYGAPYNARIVNFSWGTLANVYQAHALDIDDFIAAKRDALVFIAAGNEGAQDQNNDGVPDFGTVSSPGTAKNSLAIGASLNANTGNSPNSRAGFSSKGPAVDVNTVNRVMPQLMAPGGEPANGGFLGLSSEFACRSNDNNQDNPVMCDIVSGLPGTSFSSPAAAGAGLVVRDYFAQGFYPDKQQDEGDRSSSISAALVKAVLIASADFMDGTGLNIEYRWNNEQGYGRIQLDKALPLESWPDSPSGILVHDPFSGTSNMNLAANLPVTGDSTSDTFTVCNDVEPLSIVLAWTDATNVSGALVNDLNLKVTSPTGKEYRGNYFTDDNNQDGTLNPGPFQKEDCPPLGSREKDMTLNSEPWSLATCDASKILGTGSAVNEYDLTNVTEAIFLSPDPEGNPDDPNYIPQYEDGTCQPGSSNINGTDGAGSCGNDQDCSNTAPATVAGDWCEGGTKQPEIGDWTIEVIRPAGGGGTQDFAVAITGGVCLGSSVRFNAGSYSCNAPAVVQVSELVDLNDPGCSSETTCPESTIEGRTTVRAWDGALMVDCEGPDCAVPTSLSFTKNSGSLVFESDAINLTDGTVATPGNGTLDIRDGYRVEVVYSDKENGGVDTKERRSSASVGCQVALGYGAIQFIQWGQDSAVRVGGGCERALERYERCVDGTCEGGSGDSCDLDVDCPKRPQGFFEFGYPDRYMDANELIDYQVAFQSEEAIDLSNVLAALRCVNTDADSPADCQPSGAGCDPAECGGVCDPRRENNTACPYMTVLNTPQLLGLVPASAGMTANYSIQMGSDSVFGGSSPTVEMLLEVTSDASGRTASGLAVSRQRLNVDTQQLLYNTDFPGGGIAAEVLDMNNNEREENPITAGGNYQGEDFRLETKTYTSLTVGKDAEGEIVGRNSNLLAPWNFDGNNGGFTNGLNSTTDETGAQSNLIANWGEDKNFNGIEDGQCAENSAIGCWVFPVDARCPGAGGCVSIENNMNNGLFVQNHNQLGGCGWQTRSPHSCSIVSRGCFDDTDCEGTCQVDNSILSTFDPCTTGSCPNVNQCNENLSQSNLLGACDDDADCGCLPATGCCESIVQNCEGAAGTCNTEGDPRVAGGAWHTGQIGALGTDCESSQCVKFKRVSGTDGSKIWWELLLTPVMEKVDQSETDGIRNADANIAMWAWNMSMDLPDINTTYTWEFDTDTETLFPVDLVADNTILRSGTGPYGPVNNENNPNLSNGWNLFAPMGRCSTLTCTGSGDVCVDDFNCPDDECVLLDECDTDAGFCTESPAVPCTNDTPCEANFCLLSPAVPCTGNEPDGESPCVNHDTCLGSNTATGACAADIGCAPGTCTAPAPAEGEPCHVDADCSALAEGSTCDGADGCAQVTVSYNGTEGNNRVGQNSCFFEGFGTIPNNELQDIGTANPPDDDIDNDGDTFIDEFVTAAGPLRTHDIVAWNGPDMRLNTLEDIFGDTGNSFQAALGLLTAEGDGQQSKQGFGMSIDDMFVEWFEFSQVADATECSTGQCAVIDVPSVVIYEGVTSLPISLLDSTPYGRACRGGANSGQVCFAANGNADCPSGVCEANGNDCDLDGVYPVFPTPPDFDCNDNGVDDVVILASSEADLGEIVVLDRVSDGSFEYRGNVAVSVLADSPGVVYLVQDGEDNPSVDLTYLDYDDGNGNICQNNVVLDNRGRVQTTAAVGVATCDVRLVSTSFVDNGDSDLFMDSQETIDLNFSLENNCGRVLTNCVARLSSNSPEVECIKTGLVPLGDIPLPDAQNPIFVVPDPFVFKLDDDLADRTFLNLTANNELSASFNVSISCTEIDGLEFPQNFSNTLDLNLNDGGQLPIEWFEGFEAGGGNPADPLVGTQFTPENNDAGLAGNNNTEGLQNSDGYRCQYSDPDWVNGNSYNVPATGDICFVGASFEQGNRIYWKLDGIGALNTPDGGRAYRGDKSMYYGVFLGTAEENFTSPISTIEGVSTGLLNLGTDDPELSFWQQISLLDWRSLNTQDNRTVDKGVVQIKLHDDAGNPISDWMNLQPIQNAYAQQAEDNYFSCYFDPIDDGNTEDDFFNPDDPDRRTGPSSTCFPEVNWAWMGSTTGSFATTDVGPYVNTPPVASDAPDLGEGTWIQSKVDLSEFRGRVAKIRYLVTCKKGIGDNNNQAWGDSLDHRDDGWWLDDIFIDQVFTEAATFDKDDYTMGHCSSNDESCIAQCKFTLDACDDDDDCGINEPCLRPCPGGSLACLAGPPGCGDVCTVVTPHTWITPDQVLDPGTVSTPVPGQAVTINGAAPANTSTGALPSTADACLSGNLQYQFCRDGDPLGDGPNDPDGDCDDPWDLLLRGWTENSVLTVAPQATAGYTMEVRCSALNSCQSAQLVNIAVTCPNSANALGLKAIRWLDKDTIEWSGAPLVVDIWQSTEYGNALSLASYPGSRSNNQGPQTSIDASLVDPDDNKVVAFLVKADGNLNTIPTNFYCNSVSWRSGGISEIPWTGPGGVDRDATLGN